MVTWVTVCDTCKREDWDSRGVEETDGTALAALVESLPRTADVRVRRHGCLMGCGKGCNVTIQASGKLCYTLGGFTPDVATAEGILDYARLHAASETGQVPFRQWPKAIKGHFVTRHPPLPRD